MAHTQYGPGFRVWLDENGRVRLRFDKRNGELVIAPTQASELALNILTITGDLRAEIDESEGEPTRVYVSVDPVQAAEWLPVLPLLRGERPAS